MPGKSTVERSGTVENPVNELDTVIRGVKDRPNQMSTQSQTDGPYDNLPDALNNAGAPAAWITTDEEGEESRESMFIRGSREEPDGSVRVLCQREGKDELLDTSWERVETLR